MTKRNFIIGVVFILIIVLVLSLFIFYFQKKATKVFQATKEQPSGVSDNQSVSLISEQKKMNQVEKVSFRTDDNVEIVADYYSVDDAKFAGILVHMLGHSRKDFTTLAKQLQSNGYTVLAVDLRGHGESVNSSKGRLNYRNFTNEDYQNSLFDLEAASKFLQARGFSLSNQFLVGASIGANLTFRFISDHQDVKAAVLLSPGLNYHGVSIGSLAQPSNSQRVLIITAKGDEYSYQTTKELAAKMPEAKSLVYPDDSHGTDLFRDNRELPDKIINWLKEKLI
jgi:alpha-beta hydrolase superfamily lysophospholipase